MEIRAIQPSEIEAARRLAVANAWDRGVASAEEFRELLSRSHRVLVAVENGEVIGFLRAFCDGISNGYISMLWFQNITDARVLAARWSTRSWGTIAKSRGSFGPQPSVPLRFTKKLVLSGRKLQWSVQVQ